VAKLILYQNSNATVAFDGGPVAADWMAASLVIQREGQTISYPLTPSVAIPTQILAARGSDWTLKPQQGTRVSVPAGFRDASGSPLDFLGRRFSNIAGYAAELRLTVNGYSATSFQTELALHVCGHVELAVKASVSIFSDAAVCFDLTFSNLTELPSTKLPHVKLRLPEIAFEWPDFDWPWPSGSAGLPSLPPFPWSMGWPALEFPSLFLKLSWQRVGLFEKDPGNGDHTLVLEVIGLRIEGPTGCAIDASLHLEWINGQIGTGSYIKLPGPPPVILQVKHWYVDEECIAVAWTGTQLEQWLKLVLPEALVPDLQADAEIAVRLLRDAGEVSEVRIDYQPSGPAGEWIMKLPGFAIDVPKPRHWSMVVWRGDDQWRAGLFSTFSGDEVVTAYTTFALSKDDEPRRLHGDDDKRSERLLELTATVLPTHGPTPRPPMAPADDDEDGPTNARDDQGWLTIALATVGLESGKPEFLRKTEYALPPLNFSDNATLSEPISRIERIAQTDISASIKINPSKLPFFKRDGFQAWKQYLEIDAKPTMIDWTLPGFKVPIKLLLHLGAITGGGKLDLESEGNLNFNWERFAFSATGLDVISLNLPEPRELDFLGLNWRFAGNETHKLFDLVLNGDNFILKQAEGSLIEARFARITSPSEPLVFAVNGFSIGPGGINLDASMHKCHARLNGVATRFEFSGASFQVRDNRITGFTVTGAGQLPPNLVGEASADIALQFGQGSSGNLELISAAAHLKGKNLLRCESTRFEFSVDGLGLSFVNDHGDYHLYFTLTGVARFRPLAGDDSEGPLAWLPKIEMQFVDCPLAGDASVLRNHIRFYVEMPKKVKFQFLGCFEFELRGLGFEPGSEHWDDRPAAMQLCGQIKFAVDGGDVVDARFDFHNMLVALPAPGEFFPRLRCRDLGLKLRAGEAFELEGTIDFLEGDEIEPGWRARGFRGLGAVTIMGLPKVSATFAFLRVLRPEPYRWERAWFLYAEMRHLSIQIPAPIPIYIREVGLGFGYRYTLAMLKAADETNDIKQLIRELDKLAGSQGNLSNVSAWRLDIEALDEKPRWTVAMRGMLSTASAAASVTDWKDSVERTLPNVFLMDAVMALRTDLTFFLNARAWLYTNYYDFDMDTNGVRTRPLVAGYALFQPRKHRLLAHAASQPDPAFGDHPPMWEFVKAALRAPRYSTTLLIEPNLFHMELGWPNVLRWGMNIGPLTIECRGGSITRITPHEMVQGFSFEGRGSLQISAGFDAGAIGANLTAVASVAFGARFIAVLGFDRIDRSAFYGAVGLEICVRVSISIWIKINIGFCKITLSFGFSFEIGFTALLEVGATLDAAPGCRGTATLSIGLMGRSLRFNIHVGILEDTVNRAVAIAKPFLNMGLEATEVEPLPGETSAQLLQTISPVRVSRLEVLTGLATDLGDEPAWFAMPDYDLLTIPVAGSKDEKTRFLLVLVPSARHLETPPSGNKKLLGFLPVPPNRDLRQADIIDFAWAPPTAIAGSVEHFSDDDHWTSAAAGEFSWAIQWRTVVGKKPADKPSGEDPTFLDLMEAAYIPRKLGTTELIRDPEHLDGLQEEHPRTDPRVGDPSDAAYEASVRGTLEQFEGSPYLKHDPNVDYETQLLNAFSDTTTLYARGGKVPDGDPAETDAMLAQKQAHELRGTIINGLIEDAKAYANLIARNASDAELKEFRKNSVAFICGLVFRYTDPTPPWLQKAPNVVGGTIKQRLSRTDSMPDAARPREVRAYNTSQTSFVNHPPSFDAIKHVASESTIAINWEISWPHSTAPEHTPEHHLRHYHVVRRPVGVSGVDQQFYVKRSTIQYREGDKLITLPSRFQFVDNFREESPEDAAPLGVSRRYLYTITPVDLAGQRSQRSLSIFAERRPQQPPPAPEDAEVEVKYALARGDFDPVQADIPFSKRLLAPQSIIISTLKPALSDTANEPPPASWKLVLRRERTLPIGNYPADAASENPRQSAPASNARVLPGDVVVELGPAEPGQTKDNVGSGEHALRERQQWSMASDKTLLAALEANGVIPPASSASAADWRPSAWRAFVQTVSSACVPSTLSPAKLRIEFMLGGKVEERRPELLEWIFRPSMPVINDPVDGRADADFASVPRPIAEGDNADKPVVLDLGAAELKNQPLSFRPHPKQWRAARLGWNVVPQDAPQWQRELLSAFRVYEFDVDTQTAEALEDPDLTFEGFFELTRQIREIRLLPADQLPLSPNENLAPDEWEAWYPSSARRVRLREQDDLAFSTGRGADTWLSNWFSWRDSYLDWPALPAGWSKVRSQGGEPVFLAEPATVTHDVETGRLILTFAPPPSDWIPSQVTQRQAKLNELASSAALEISGFAKQHHNGVKWLKDFAPTATGFSFGFELAAFPSPKPDAAMVIDIVLSQPRANLHWLLEQLIRDIENRAAGDMGAEAARLYGVASDPSLTPPGKATDLEGLQDETAPGADSYGWNALKRLGLSAAVTFRSIRDGRAIPARDLWQLIQAVLHGYQQTESSRWFKYLHIELLFQPARSIRLDSDPDARPSEDDLLALVQFSLRPAVVPVMEYKVCVLEPENPQNAPEAVTVSVSASDSAPPDWQLDVIVPGQTGIGFSLNVTTPEASATVAAGARGRVVLIMRTTANTEAVVSITEAKYKGEKVTYARPTFTALSLNDERLRLFPDITDRWLAVPVPNAPEGAEFGPDEPLDGSLAKRHWWRLDRYLRLAGLRTPVKHDWVSTLNSAKTFNWLRRFFNFSGDFNFSEGAAGPWSYGTGPWLATAYPQANADGFAALRRGRTELYHVIDDGWAHAFRYFVQPLSRYDQLWLALAQSAALFPAAKDRESNVRGLLGLNTKIALGQGGLDISVPRIRRVAPPLVLSSRRLDPPVSSGATTPSAVWEVVLAKHPEQTLTERNRTLAQRMEFRHTAFALVRKFAYIRELDAFFEALGSDSERLTQWKQVELVQDTYLSADEPRRPNPAVVLPGPVSEPDWIELPVDPISVTNKQRSLLLTDRLDPFERDAIALQWRDLPFFYEHRALFKAEAAAVASPAVAVSHSEFEFHSPAPIAVKDAFIDDVNGVAQLVFYLPLNSFWESLPAKTKWEIENPKVETSGDAPFRPKLSALPDVGVSYDILHSGGPTAGTVEPIATIAFTRSDSGYAWTLRELTSRFKSSLGSIIAAPPAGPQRDEHRFRLRVQTKSLLAHASIEDAVRNRYDFDENDAATFGTGLAIRPPGHLALALTGHLTATEADHLHALAKDSDPYLAAALRALIAGAPDSESPAAITNVKASAGLEQILQVACFKDSTKRMTLEPDERKLIWRGYFTQDEIKALSAWKDSTPFYRTVGALLDAAVASRKIAFTAATFAVPPEFPTRTIHIIKGAPTTKPGEFNYTLVKDPGPLDPASLTIVKRPPDSWPTDLRNALTALRDVLDTLVIGILEAEWRPRFDESMLGSTLADKLLLGQSFLASAGLLSHKRAEALLKLLTAQKPPASDAVRRLYWKSLKSGAAGGSLRLRTRRSSSSLVTATEDIQPKPL
jgi:hypothetical protein